MLAISDRILLQSEPNGEVYAVGKALFVIPKPTAPLSQQNGLEESMSKLQTAPAQTAHIVDQAENKT